MTWERRRIRSVAPGVGPTIRGCLIEGQSNAGKSTLSRALVDALRVSGCPARVRKVTMTDAPVLDELHRLSFGDFDGWTPELALRRFNVCQSARLMLDSAQSSQTTGSEYGDGGGNGDYIVYERGWWGQLLFNDFFTPDGHYLPDGWVRTAPRFETRVYLLCDRRTRVERSRARHGHGHGASRLQAFHRYDVDGAGALDDAALARIEQEGGWHVYDTGAKPLDEIVADLVHAILGR